MLLIQLLLFSLAAFWGFSYYLRSTKEVPKRIQKEPPEEIKRHEIQSPPKYNRMQLEKTAANCLYFSLTPTEREQINVFAKCRNASDKELFEIIENFENY